MMWLGIGKPGFNFHFRAGECILMLERMMFTTPRASRIRNLLCGAAMALAMSRGGLAMGGQIHEAAAAGNLDAVKSMLERKPSLVRSRDYGEYSPVFVFFPWGPWGDTPLIRAAFHDRTAIEQLLISYGADVDAHGGKGWTPMYAAAVWGYASTVKVLLAHNADINEPIKDGETPLHAAAKNCQPEMVKLLIENHADVNAVDRSGETPLWLAEQNGGSFQIVNMLLKAGGHE
jgi:ankyrin repeat protein